MTLYDEEGDEKALHVWYYLVPQTTLDDELAEDRVMGGDDLDAKTGYQAGKLSKMVAEWDLLGDDGKPIPLEADAIRAQVPLPLLYDILDAIKRDRDPNPSTSSSSDPSTQAG